MLLSSTDKDHAQYIFELNFLTNLKQEQIVKLRNCRVQEKV